MGMEPHRPEGNTGSLDYREALEVLEWSIALARPADCPALVGELERLKGMVWCRMMGQMATTITSDHDLLTIPEVAKRLKVSEYRAYELARQGTLKSIRLGKSVRVKPGAVAEYLGGRGSLDK